MSTHSDYIRKIQGLLKTAESYAEQGNEEAAQAFVAKAHQLQHKYSIDEAMIAAANGTEAQAIIDRVVWMPGPYGRRQVELAGVVATAAGCACCFRRQRDDGRYRVTAFGYPADVEWFEALLVSLIHQAQAGLAAAERDPYENGRTFAVGFMEGFTHRIAERLGKASRETEQAAERERQSAQAVGGIRGATPSVAVVLANKAKRVEEELKARVGLLRTRNLAPVDSWSGYDQGWNAGGRASLSHGAVGDGSLKSLER